jgi:spore germination protein YaaH
MAHRPHFRTLAIAGACAGTLWACASLPFTRPSASLWSFTAPWDTNSAASARRHAEQMDALVSGWFALDSMTAQPVQLYPEAVASPGVPASTIRFALITSFEYDRFHPETIRRLAGDSVLLGVVAGRVSDLIAANGYRGVVLDFEGMAATDGDSLFRVINQLARSLHARKIQPVVVAVPASDTITYPARSVLHTADMMLVMLYDEHWAGSPPGPVASPDWARRQLGARVQEAGASRVVVSLPAYGYLWSAGGGPAAVIGYDDAKRSALRASVPLARDPSSQNVHAVAPGQWELWVSDSALVATLVSDARQLGVNRFALWRLGLEDPGVWTIFQH